MGLLFRVRLASFFAGAAASSAVGFHLLYKDYMLAHDAVSQQVKDIYESLDERYEAMSARVKALENPKEAEAATPTD